MKSQAFTGSGLPLGCPFPPAEVIWHQEVIICGWQPGRGGRANTIGSLQLGAYDDDRLLYAGNVGTGFTEAMLADLMRQLGPLQHDTSPFGTPVPPRYARGAHWVEPRLVGEVAFSKWTADGSMRHPSWHGLRAGKDPGRCTAMAEDYAATASR